MGLRIRRAGEDTPEAENALSWDAVEPRAAHITFNGNPLADP